MPNYTIHIHQGSHTNSHPDWRIEVIEPAGGTIFRLGILAEDAALAVFSLDGRERRLRH